VSCLDASKIVSAVPHVCRFECNCSMVWMEACYLHACADVHDAVHPWCEAVRALPTLSDVAPACTCGCLPAVDLPCQVPQPIAA
jgi:hypothetical protein